MLIPPLLITTLGGSRIFLTALDLTGTYGITFLFGILPAIMAFSARYQAK